MSRCNLDNEETGVEVVVGWDPGLHTFFAQAIVPDADEPYLWLGTSPAEFQDEVGIRKLLAAVSHAARSFDHDAVLRALLDDMREGSERIYEPQDVDVVSRS